jgi:hypothetical protein
MRMESHSGREAITGKLIRARRLRMQMALQLLVFSGVIRRVALQPSEAADNVISASSS